MARGRRLQPFRRSMEKRKRGNGLFLPFLLSCFRTGTPELAHASNHPVGKEEKRMGTLPAKKLILLFSGGGKEGSFRT